MKRRGPTCRVWFSRDEQETPRELVSGQHFRVNYHGISRGLYQTLPLLMVDLLRIASARYVIDRTAKRGGRSSPCGWVRSPRVSVEVLEPDFWKGAEVRKT